MANHVAQRMRPRWSRKRKVTVATTILAIIGVGVAVAVLLFRAPLGGNVNVVDVKAAWLETVPVQATTVEGEATCSGSLSGPFPNVQLNVSMTNAIPGSACEFSAYLRSSGAAGSPQLKVQDIVFNENLDVAFSNGTCGLTLPTSNGTTRNVTFRITAPVGTSGSYAASADAGVNAVLAADYVDADCPRVTS